MMRRKEIIALGALVLAGAIPRVAASDILVVVGGTVHPVSGDAYVGNVAMEDGVITAAGPDVAVPAGVATIDAEGLHVYPGLMDAMGQVGLIEVGSVPATDDQSEMGMYNAHLVAATAIHPASELIGVTRANGITHALVAPRAEQDGVMAGQASLVHLDGWTVEEMAIEPSTAMVIAWPEIVTRRFDFATFSFKDSAFEEAKEKALEKQNELRDWLDASRHYRKAMNIEKPRASRDLRLFHLARVLDGGLPVIVQADNERDIEAAIEFSEQEGLHMILAGGRDAWKLAGLLAEKEINVILSATQSLPREEDDPYDTPFRAPGVLAEAGVKVAFGSGATGGYGGSAHAARVLPYEAAMAAAYGLPGEDALKALTLWPAEILGVAEQLGTIEPGKLANLIVTTGDPLKIQTEVRHLVIDGREVSTDNRHRRLYERYRSRPSR